MVDGAVADRNQRLAGGRPTAFTLCHEFKHVLDHRHLDLLYPPATGRRESAERICDYFAACPLMPSSWVKAAWDAGSKDVWAAASTFKVSRQAMEVRLTHLGLLRSPSRCATSIG